MTHERLDPQERALLRATRAFEARTTARAVWSVATSFVAAAAVLVAMRVAGPVWAFVWCVPLALVNMRLFVMQHDCGHRSLWPERRHNDLCGRLIAVYTGIGYDAWRTEHDWHHQVTGRMDRRGIDRFNSPMTAEEARADPVRARAFERKVKWWRIAWLGMLSLLLERRRAHAYFMFRPAFVWRFDRAFIVRSVRLSNVAHLAFQAALVAWLGWATWAAVVVGYVLSGFIGAVTFWVQHNFEHAVIRPGERWSFVEAALRGSSYLRVPWPLRWFSGDIGLHHVHHLNAHIPHYRLEEARRALPELAAVTPLSLADVRTAFTHHYFDEQRDRRISWAELQHGVTTTTAATDTASTNVTAEYA